MAYRSESRKAITDYKELAAFFEDLGMMIQSGISVNEAVSLLNESSAGSSAQMCSALERLIHSMEEGSGLASAMKDSGAFPEYSIEIISASEYTGRLEEALFNLSEYYVTESDMNRSLISSVRYPAILLVMVMAVLAALLLLVFPAFYDVYNNLTGSLSASSYSIIGIAFLLCKVVMAVLAVCAVLGTGCVCSWKRGNREKVLGRLSRFRHFGELQDSIDLYRFSSCLGLFIAAGENQDSAVERSLGAAGTGAVRDSTEKCLALMAEGKSFSQAVYEERLYDKTDCRILMSAERSGMLENALERVSDDLRKKAEAKASEIANTAEPLLTGSMMIFIGLILVSIMFPLIGIMNTMG